MKNKVEVKGFEPWFTKLLSSDDYNNNGRFSCKNEIENMSPPETPETKH